MGNETAQGVTLPAVGFGTYRMNDEETYEATLGAIESGYRHIDTAQMYENEAAVGEAIADADVPRDELFVTTKLWPKEHRADEVRENTRASLDRLDVDTIDLMLLHSPKFASFDGDPDEDEVPIEETIGVLNEFQAAGDIEHVGVSNFDAAECEATMAVSETPILTNQVEYNPFHPQDAMIDFCQAEDLILTAYRPLGDGKVLEDETIGTIAERYGKTPAQVGIRWLIQQDGVITIPKAADPDHRRENIEVFDFELTADEMKQIAALTG